MGAKQKAQVAKRRVEGVTVKKLVDDFIYRIDLDADYQREKIWSRSNQEQLLDSILKDIDIPKLYLATTPDNESFDFECIDGKQRMTTLLSFYKPEKDETPLTVRVAGKKYTYKQLKEQFSQLAKTIDDFELTFVIYPPLDDEEFIREIFRRLQLGVRLNAGELLKTFSGTIRDFVYKEMGAEAPFLRNTNLSVKRFSRPFTLAQICINSFARKETGEFVRARYNDLEEFFKDKYDLSDDDENLERIRKVLRLMDKSFGKDAHAISSRAVAVSAYLFVEDLFLENKTALAKQFAKFFSGLLHEIDANLKLLAQYKRPTNSRLLEEFQKYVSQASVEAYAIKRRHIFLREAFDAYLQKKRSLR